MDADAVRAYVALRFPGAMSSPLAQAFGQVIAQDEAERAIDFARLQAVSGVRDLDAQHDRDNDFARQDAAGRAQTEAEADHAIDLDRAMAYALQCLEVEPEHDEESISCHIESNFPDFSADECDEIAEAAIKQVRRA